jgi:hypothetical protein
MDSPLPAELWNEIGIRCSLHTLLRYVISLHVERGLTFHRWARVSLACKVKHQLCNRSFDRLTFYDTDINGDPRSFSSIQAANTSLLTNTAETHFHLLAHLTSLQALGSWAGNSLKEPCTNVVSRLTTLKTLEYFFATVTAEGVSLSTRVRYCPSDLIIYSA